MEHRFFEILAIGSVCVLVLGISADFIKRYVPASEALLALIVGIVLGPEVLGFVDLGAIEHHFKILEIVAWLTLSVSLLGVALELPRDYVRRCWRSLLVMIGPVMLLMCLVSGGVSYLFVGAELGLVGAFLLGAVVTPTDPVVAGGIVSGEFASDNLPARLRDILKGESGANDGMALALVMLPVLWLKHEPGAALREWVLKVLLWEVGLALVLGAVIGYLTGELVDRARGGEREPSPSLMTVGVGLSLAVGSVTRLIDSDGLLAVFAAGIALNYALQRDLDERERQIQEASKHFFDVPVFIMLGTALPWGDWAALGWRGPALAVTLLLLRRLPVIWAMKRWASPLQRPRDAWFAGWFGPIGVAAVFYAMLAVQKTGQDVVWPWASLIIASSVLAHGVSSMPLTRLYGAVSGRSAGGGDPDDDGSDGDEEGGQ